MYKMPNYIKRIHEHQKVSDAIVQETLKQISKDNSVPYAKTKKLFIEGNYSVTLSFWRLVNATDSKYTGVEYCHGCAKFDLFTE